MLRWTVKAAAVVATAAALLLEQAVGAWYNAPEDEETARRALGLGRGLPMTITIDLPPDVADRLARKATEDGQGVAGYVRRLAVRDAGTPDAQASSEWDALRDSFAEGDAEDHRDAVETRALNEGRPTRSYDPAGLAAALKAFDGDDEQEQRETLAYLRTALDRDRPGQRRVFGEGVNPMPSVDDAA